MMAFVKRNASALGGRSKGTATRESALTAGGDHRPASCRGLRVGRDLWGVPLDPTLRRGASVGRPLLVALVVLVISSATGACTGW